MSVRSAAKWLVPLILALAAGAAAWFLLQPADEAPGFASGNGRIEATEVNVATKLAGRLVEVRVQEGDFVEPGQILARMDTKTLEADLREARASVDQAGHAMDSAQAAVNQQQDAIVSAQALVAQRASQLKLSEKDLQRYRDLLEQGATAVQTVDSAETQMKTDRAQLDAARAQLGAAQSALLSAQARVLQAQASVEAAKARTETIQTQIDDSTLEAPTSGRVLYRLAEPGEVLAPGGAVVTLLDIGDVYMTLFLPTTTVGLVDIGAEARIVLDVRPDLSVPAKVSYVSPEAQFTPKSVETRTEREKLMFRVKVKVDPALLRAYAQKVKTGLPGVAWVRMDPDAAWPGEVPPVVHVPGEGTGNGDGPGNGTAQ